MAHVESDKRYINAHGFNDSLVDEAVLKTFVDGGTGPVGLYGHFAKTVVCVMFKE